MSKHLFRAFSTCLLTLFLFACESEESTEGSLTVQRDLTLSSLSVNGQSLDPVFSSTNPGPYEVSVPQSVDSIEITIGSPTDTDQVNILAFRNVVATNANPVFREDEQVVAPNASLSFSLEPGVNFFTIRVQTDDEEQRIDYRVEVYRESDVAELGGIGFDDLDNVAGTLIEFSNPDTFDSEVFDYTLSAPFNSCSVGVSAVAFGRDSRIELDGETLARGSVRFIDLDVGSNPITLNVTSENGENEQAYTFDLVRAEQGTDDAEGNNTLASLNFSSGDLRSGNGTEGFNCLLTTYDLRIDSDQAEVSISAVPTITGRTVEIANVVRTTNSEGVEEVSFENPQVIPDGGSLSLTISDDIDDNTFAVSLARNDNDEVEAHYLFTVVRSTTNVVRVETGEELQLALQNALPNQEIVVSTDAALTATSAEASSGKEGSFFYSAASGTAEQPIILRGENAAILSGDNTTEGTVLELAGDYWEIRDLSISNAAYGLVLDSASNNLVENLALSDLGLRGIHIKNDSDSNAIINSSIRSVGAEAGDGEGMGEAIALGASASERELAPNLADESSLQQNNRISNVFLGPDVAGELLHVHAGAVNSVLFDVNTDSVDLGAAADASAAIIISGNETELAYSTFMNVSSANLSSAVLVRDVEAEGLGDQWGENTQFFDNYVEVTNPSLATLVADASVNDVSVDDNIRSDGEATVYSGAAIDESFASPSYAIEWLSPDLSTAQCIQSESSENGTETISLADCDTSASAQQWDLVVDGEGYVLIRPASNSVSKIAPQSGGTFRSAGGLDLLILDDDQGTDLDQAFSARWRFTYVDGEFAQIANKFGPAYGFTVIGSGEEGSAENLAFIGLLVGSDRQLFRLVPLD